MAELFSIIIYNLMSALCINNDNVYQNIVLNVFIIELFKVFIYNLTNIVITSSDNPYQYTVTSFAGQVLSVVIGGMIAVIANSSLHSQKLEQEDRIAHANIKPLLFVDFINSDDNKAVILYNYGIGTAVLKHITFSKGHKVEHNLISNLFSFDRDFKWTGWWGLTQDSYIHSDKGKVLVKLTRKNLTKQGFNSATIDRIFKSWVNQLNQITIVIEYEDILGKKQVDCVRDFGFVNQKGYAKRARRKSALWRCSRITGRSKPSIRPDGGLLRCSKPSSRVR